MVKVLSIYFRVIIILTCNLNPTLTLVCCLLSLVRIDAGLQQGDQLNFNVTANFIVDYFNGTKSIVISNTGDLGGQMSYWAESMTTVGIIVLCLALILAVRRCCGLS